MFTDCEGRLQPAWAFLLAALLSALGFIACGYVASAFSGDHVLRFELIFRTILAAYLLLAFTWLLTVGNHVETHQLAAQGLPRSPGWQRQLFAGLGLGFVLVVLAVLAVALFGHLQFHANWTARSFPRIIAVVWVLVLGSLAEELMFRGYPFQRLAEAIGSAAAILVFSVLFGLVHLLNPGATFWGLLNTVVIGVVLSLCYLRTRALWLPWGLHFAWNATLGLVFGLPVSGIHLFNVIVKANASGPRWLTGGAYGLEASLPGAAVVLLALLVITLAPLRPLLFAPPGPGPNQQLPIDN